MTPSIAALLGRWFWWPQIVRPRPASSLLQPVAPRPVARVLLLREQDGATSRRHAAHDDDTQPLDLVGNGHHRRVQLSDRFADVHGHPGLGE
jgi:putative drug exporter of the RND superfamily